MRKKILFMTYDGLTDMLGQSQVLPYILGLAQKGYSFTILSCEKKDKFYQNRDLILEKLAPYDIQWDYIFFTSKPRLLAKAWDLFKFRRKAFQLYRKNNFDLLHCRSYVTSQVGLALKKSLGAKFLFDMRGFWVDERVDGGLWNQSNPIYKYLFWRYKKLESEFLENAEHTISLTESGKNELHSWKHLNNQPIKISVIPCSADLSHFNRDGFSVSDISKKRAEIGLFAEDFVLSYLGSIGTWYLLKEMLLFFKLVLKKKPNAKFIFITPDPPSLIEAEAIKLGINLKDIFVFGESRKGVPLSLLCSNISVFFIKQSYSKISSSPTKQGEIMGLGIPVICNSKVGDVKAIVEKYQSGVCIDNFSEGELKRAADSLDELLGLDPRHIQEGAEDYYDLQKAIDQYAKAYESIFKS